MEPPFSPPIGLGTAMGRDPDAEACAAAVETALEVGYRHVDTAQVYDTEAAVGEGLRRADVDREEVFVATKTAHIDVPGPGRETLVESVHESREKLGVGTIDLLYVHWPMGIYDPEVTLPAFDDLHDEGVVDYVGLSNFTPALLDEARAVLDAPVLAHQVETHPLLQQDDLVAYAQRHDLLHVAYTPLIAGEVFDVPELSAVAEKHGVTEAAVSLAWLHGRDNVVPIPQSTDPAHLRANLDALELDLDEEDVARIEGIDRERRLVDPEGAPFNA